MTSFGYRKKVAEAVLKRKLLSLCEKGFTQGGREMNGESQVLVTDAVLFPVQEKEIIEKKEIGEFEIKVSTLETEIKIEETRFARLKKSLRKRSRGIL